MASSTVVAALYRAGLQAHAGDVSMNEWGVGVR